MRAAVLVLALSPLAACIGELPEETAIGSEVIGGTNAPRGKWPDVAAVLFNGQPQCSGVLVAPTVALTAGHCNDPQLRSILLGTTSLVRPGEGETLNVVKRIEHPNSFATEDLTVLVLERASKLAPRAIATGWARADIVNGARAAIVGYGAIDRDATEYVDDLREAETTITDADCTQKLGCNGAVAPGGELGAGGMGIDTCPGDSGGPLYLLTGYGTFVAGITSRSYDDAQYFCSDGGIYARPDKVIDWIEEVAGVPVARAPGPTVEPLSALRGGAGETSIAVNDPKQTSHRFAITAPPARGTAKVRGDGRVRVCANPDAEPGPDAVEVTVSDAKAPARKVSVTVPVTIEDGAAVAACDVDDFEDAGGCCDSRRSATGSLPLALGVLAVLRRRRRARA